MVVAGGTNSWRKNMGGDNLHTEIVNVQWKIVLGTHGATNHISFKYDIVRGVSK